MNRPDEPALAGRAAGPGPRCDAGEGRVIARRPRAAAIVLAAYALLAVMLFAQSWFELGRRIPGNGGDAGLFVWDLGWTPFALAHHSTPLLTDYLLFPSGANLMWSTSILVPAVVMWPVTVIAGPIVSYTILMTGAMALSAWCAYLACRRYAGVAGSAVGGLLYGFSPYMIVHGLGHANLAIAVFPPLVLLALDEILVRQRHSRWWMGVALGGGGALQLLTGEELLFTTAAAAAVGAGTLLVLRFQSVRARARHALSALVTAAVTSLLLGAVPLWVQFTGPNQVHGLLHPRNLFVNDVLATVVPTAFYYGPQIAKARDTAGETSAYLGIPLLLLLAWGCYRWRRRLEVQVAMVLGLIAMVLSFGSTLHIGYRTTRVPLPFHLFAALPVLENLIPARFMIFTYLMAALVLAVVIDRSAVGRGWWRRPVVYAVAVSLLPLVPVLPYPSTSAAVPPYFASGGGVASLRAGGAVVVAPYFAIDPMVWQATAGFRFRLTNGSAYRPGPAYGPPPSAVASVMSQLELLPQSPPDRVQTAAVLNELRGEHLEALIVGPGPGAARMVAFFSAALRTMPERSGGVAVWRRPLRA